MIAGEFRQWREGTTEAQLFKAGDTVIHDMGEVTAVHWTQGTWMLEYGRGFIPSTMGFAIFSDTVFSSQDIYRIYKTVKLYAIALLQELQQGNM